ncbi:hypothetical protein BER2_1681 [plant metagenome]|uniref:Phage protein n=1 Tax=plant metagenome TaxID=1297885 RepID=A0A484R1B0_9ZZZZ
MGETDKELLLLAAHANWAEDVKNDEVGIRYCEREEAILYLHADNQDHNGVDREFRWNPLEEDGDALQLAVKLRMGVTHNDPRGQKRYCSADVGVFVAPIFESITAVEEFDDEAQRPAATRRAIVRAAAKIALHTEGA